MVPSFIILFRETLEIAIILSIILAATRGVSGRARYILTGIGGGIAGSALVALFMEQITAAMQGMGQELFNGTVLLVASAMIAWTTIWMQTHGRQITKKMKEVGASIRDGDVPLYSLAVVVSLSMWREGAEIAMFMTGIIATSEETLAGILAGAFAGAGVAAIVGLLIYFGIITLSSKYLFKVTGWMLILLASGMAAAGAGYFVSADVLPAIAYDVWDTSNILSEGSLTGKILGAMFGYSARPMAIQLLFYAGTLLLILGILKLRKGPQAKAVSA